MQRRTFSKAAPDHRAFSLIPESTWNPKSPLESLCLSRILAGVSTFDSDYTTSSGRSLTVPAGSAWCSIQTIREDISSAIGEVIPRHRIKYAIRKLDGSGILKSTNALPSTCGRYGKFWTPEIDTTEPTVDPVTEYRIHAYGNTSAFRHGGIATASPSIEWAQKQPGDVRALMERVAEKGNSQALFRTVGMWRDRRDVRRVGKPVFLPWIVLDIDERGDIPLAHETALKILMDMEDAGIDMERTFVSFSGSKGFHIAIATSQIGCPVFRDSDNARAVIVKFVEFMTDHEFDPSTLSPLQMLRLTGSKHESTGFYKTTWFAPRFRSLKLHEIIERAKSHEPWEYPDPTVGDVESDIFEEFEWIAIEQAQDAWQRIQSQAAKPEDSWHEPKGDLITILDGVARGEKWGSHSGRDWAAFTLGCYCFTHPKQHEAARRYLNMPEIACEQTFASVKDTLAHWNERNTPPLTLREINQKAGSAERYIERRS